MMIGVKGQIVGEVQIAFDGKWFSSRSDAHKIALAKRNFIGNWSYVLTRSK